MCDFYSCIVTKKGEILEPINTNSHESIITEHNLEDVSLVDRSFVRIEIVPNSFKNLFSKDRSNWKFKVDEPKTIPVWFEEDSTKYTNLAWDAWQKFMDAIPFVDNVEKIIEELSIPLEVNSQSGAIDYANITDMEYSDVSKAGLFGYLFECAWKLNKITGRKMSSMDIGSKILVVEKVKALAKERKQYV